MVVGLMMFALISKMTLMSYFDPKVDGYQSIPIVYCRKCPNDRKLFKLMRQAFILLPEQLTNYAAFTKYQGHFLYQVQSLFYGVHQ